MLFAAFTSAYIVRRSGSDWHHVTLPLILWFNTAVLAASSIALETREPVRRAADNGKRLFPDVPPRWRWVSRSSPARSLRGDS